MGLVFFALFAILGAVICSLGIIQMATVLRVGIPITKRLVAPLSKKTGKQMITMYTVTLIFWSAIVISVTLAVRAFAETSSFYAYLAGAAFVFLIGIGSTRKTPQNVMEFSKSAVDKMRGNGVDLQTIQQFQIMIMGTMTK